ncbi:MAG: hypothetical protein ACM3NO_10920, partial [Deltaproteobacteria bacterium]
ATSDPDLPNRVLAFPVAGGNPLPVCDFCAVRWTGDGKNLYLGFGGNSMGGGKSFVVALRPGKDFPDGLPPEGLKSASDAARLHPVKVLSGEEGRLGPDLNTYAEIRSNVHRNIFRIPIP